MACASSFKLYETTNPIDRFVGESFLGFPAGANAASNSLVAALAAELELELIQTQMAQKPMLRAEVGMRVRCANKASAE